MTNAHDVHGDTHDHHPEPMTRSAAGESVQLGPDGKFSKWSFVYRIIWLVLGAGLTIWLVAKTLALTAMPLVNGHADDAISNKAVGVLVLGVGLIVLAIVASGILIGGSGRNAMSWMTTLLFIGLWVIAVIVAVLCVQAAAPLSQAWITH